jgi:predicted phosphodiesterase
MKFQIISDIHLETNQLKIFNDLKPVADYLILAGDISPVTDKNLINFLDYISLNWKKILYVTGNHEYYDKTGALNKEQIDTIIEDIVSKYDNIYFLNNSSVIIENVEFIGSTLWSSPIKTDDLHDFQKNIFDNDLPVTLEIIRKWNQQCIKYLTLKLNKNNQSKDNQFNKKCIITHFMPLQNKDIPNSKYPTNKTVDSYFGNELYHLFSKADVWISGHTHQTFNFKFDNTPWLCNPYGNLNEKLPYKAMTYFIK